MLHKYLRHMMVFKTVVEQGSVSAAAEQLSLSKSVVSQQLGTLEQALQLQLLNRTTRRQVLTPAGRRFYQQCQQIDALNTIAWRDARIAQQMPSGELTISAPHALIDTLVAPAIGGLVATHPQITPSIQAQEKRVDLIEQQIDLAIRVGELDDSEYRQQRIGSFRDHLCIGRKYLTELALSPTELLACSSTLQSCHYIANSWQGVRIEHNLKSSHGEILALNFRADRFANSIHTVLAMVRQGAGLGLIPSFLLDGQDSEIVILTEQFSLPENPIYALHAFAHNTPPAVALSVEAIKTQMSALF
ncbi:MAG: LysR family transcriptional regulator [Pseudomonadales bacterium]